MKMIRTYSERKTEIVLHHSAFVLHYNMILKITSHRMGRKQKISAAYLIHTHSLLRIMKIRIK